MKIPAVPRTLEPRAQFLVQRVGINVHQATVFRSAVVSDPEDDAGAIQEHEGVSRLSGRHCPAKHSVGIGYLTFLVRDEGRANAVLRGCVRQIRNRIDCNAYQLDAEVLKLCTFLQIDRLL